MKAPDIIYLQTCGDCRNHELCPKECESCDFDQLAEVTWSKDKIFDTDKAYFSEENIRNVLKTVVDDANTLIDCSKRSAVFTSKIDVKMYIPHVINLLKGLPK